MNKTLAIAAITLVAVVMVMSAMAPAMAGAGGENGEDSKVTICHMPPGNPGNSVTITVSTNAVPAHLAHGDTLGPCSRD